jgi:cytochrome P450
VSNETVTRPQEDVVARLLEPAVLADPAEFYGWLRTNLPIQLHPRGFYLLSRYHDSRWMFQSPLLRGPEPGEYADRQPRLMRYRCVRLLLNTIANVNPPAHTRLRRLFSRAFVVKRIMALEPEMAASCESLLGAIEEPLRSGDTVDLHGAVIMPLALNAIAELLGVPGADREALGPLVARVLNCTTPAADDDMLDDAEAASTEMEKYFVDLIDQRRRDPRGDLISSLVGVHGDDPDRLGAEEMLSMVWGLWAGGFMTTSAAIDNAAVTMLGHPHLSDRLHAGEASLRGYVDEMFRHAAPNLITGVVRITAEEVEIGGVEIPAGSDVRAMPACANRDPDAYHDPDRFDPDRGAGDQLLTFGHGIHYCLGANLARTEMNVLLVRLNRRFPHLTTAAPPVYRRSLPLRALEQLPVALDGAGPRGG